MSAISAVSNVSAAGMTAAVSRLGDLAKAGGRPPIEPVSAVVPHKTPPAGLLAFDPTSPEVDLSSQPVEQMRALHQFRANLRVFQAANQDAQSTISLKA